MGLSIMNRNLLLSLLCCLVLTACTKITTEKDVVQATLSNGLRVVVVKSRIAPVASIYVNYLVGSNESPVNFSGTAHAVEHMTFRGSPGLSGDQINAILTGLGGESNAFTSHNVTQYVSTVPTSDLRIMLQLEAVRMRGAFIAEDQWQIERGAINQEVAASSSSTASDLLEIIYKKLFAGSLYSKDPLGTADSYNKTSSAMLRQFYQTWYTPNNAVLVISGDIDPGKTVAMVRELFGDIPARQIPQRTSSKLQPLVAEELKVRSNESYDFLMVMYRLPGIRDKDYAAGQVLAATLASQRGKLSDLIKNGDVLTATFDSFAFPGVATGYAMAAVLAGQDLRAKVTMLKNVVEEYKKSGVPPDLVEAVKLRALYDAESERNSIPALASSWSEALVAGFSTPDEERNAIQKVTVSDVNRVARTWLNNDSAITVMMPAAKSGTSEVRNMKFKRTSESFLPKKITPVALPAWAGPVNRLPTEGNRIAPSADIRLSNGLRLIVVQTDSKLITMSGIVKNQPDLQTPHGKDGVSELLEEMMSRGGSTRMPRQQFQAALDRIGAATKLGTSFYISTDEKQFEQGVSLLADALLHPELSEKEFKTIRNQYAELLTSLDKGYDWVTTYAYLKSLYPPHYPVMRRETPETLKRLTLQDVKKYHADVIRPDLTTAVVTGDITPSKAKSILERYFGSWQAQGTKPDVDLPPVPDNKPLSIHVPDSDSDQVSVILAHTCSLNRSHPDYYPFLVGLHILSGSSSSRLYQHVREQRGLVYDIGATIDVGNNCSIFRVTYGTDPKNVANVRRLIEQDIADMQKRPVSQAELEQAKRHLLRSNAMMGTSYDTIASLLLSLAEADLPLDQISRTGVLVGNVTAQQVQAAFHKWIRLNGLSQVTQGGV